MSEQTVRVQVAASLCFFLPGRYRDGVAVVPMAGEASVVQIVESLGVPRTELGELRIAGRPVDLLTRLYAGDVLEVSPVVRPQAMFSAAFVLDVHLGTLARQMRLLGLDTAYRNDASDPELVEQGIRERRIVLTQDRGLLHRKALISGAYVRGTRADAQLIDVLDRFDPRLAPWTRCLACNGVLEPVAKDEVRHLLEPGTRQSYTAFSRCGTCGHIFWRGAHARKLESIVARVSA